VDKTIVELIAKMDRDTHEASLLMEQLKQTIKIRKLFNLPDTGTVKVIHKKPSGVGVGELKNYSTDIIHNGEVVHRLPMNDFKKMMNCEVPK
jgi:hypothetical protein